MTNKIIEAARLAGATRAYPEAQSTRDDAYLVGRQFLERFYALAYRQGLEDAAKLLETKKEWRGGKWISTLSPETASAIANAIRALMKKDAAIAAGKGEG